MSEIKKNAEKAENYVCENCDFECSKHSNYLKHLSTQKHFRKSSGNVGNKPAPKMLPKFKCMLCKKKFHTNSGLWKHNKQCLEQLVASVTPVIPVLEPEPEPNTFDLEAQVKKVIEKEISNLTNKTNFDTTIDPTNNINIVLEVLKQNNELKELFVQQNMLINSKIDEQNKTTNELQSQLIEISKNSLSVANNINNGQITNNTNNNQFNIQIYLNETCKNAMNINQFLDYLQPTLQELEDTAHLGYVESISRIIMRGFKNLEEDELPFHCTDLKREHIYIKNPDEEWVKETDEKPLLLRFVKEVARRNFNNIFAWQKENPTWASYHSKKNDLYNSIVANAMSGATEKEQNDNYEKIMKNIMKNIVVDKSKKNKTK
jgi:hypothetical protein